MYIARMKRILLLVLLVIIHSQAFCQSPTGISLIPIPASLKEGTGKFVLKNTTAIELATHDSDVQRVATFLAKKLSTATGHSFHVTQSAVAGRGPTTMNSIELNLTTDTSLGNEGYKLTVNPTSVSLTAHKPAGLFYAMQTLLQLLPKEIDSKSLIKNVQWRIPAVTVVDTPRVGWRGLMLDVTRHFFTKQEVKDFIDNMVRYKFNMLHLHLTDDQGWRVQINSLPNLTTIGAWRPKREGKWGNAPAPDSTEPKSYGGFYTHDDIRELVQYAKERFVNILPEIDVPAHSMAALASYPELSCTSGAYHVNAGEKFMEWYGNGKFSALVDNTLCPAKENVYDFLDKVFTEVAAIFPFEYIHVGGDEAAKNFWEQSDTIKSLMQRENLKSMDEVQGYFERRVEQIVKAKGKKLIGWDEILEGGLAPDAAVMSWRGTQGGIEAANMKHHVVMAPNDFVYLDLMQGDRIIEPPVYSTVRFSQTYKFDPLPEGVDKQYILGGQGNLWTEQIPNVRAMQYMLFPRALAVAECVWSPVEKKNWKGFVKRVENEFERLDIEQIKYSRSMYEPIFTVLKDTTQGLKVKMEPEITDIDIFYSFNETNPDEFYPKYTSTLTVPKDAATLKVITYRNGKPVGRQINMPVSELWRRAGRK